MTVHLVGIQSKETTARYLERAITASGHRVAYHTQVIDPSRLDPQDLLFCVDPMLEPSIGLEEARCRTAVYLIDVHQHLDLRLVAANFFDVIFVAQRDYVGEFQGRPQVCWLPLACDPKVHFSPRGDRPIDVAFVGKLGPRGSRRYSVLSRVLSRFQTNDYLRFYDPCEMGRIYSEAKIVFNASIHGDLNMRVFEAMASGALLVTDRIGNGLSELFQEEVHFVGYSTIEEAVTKIDWYLHHPQERQVIANAGQGAAFERHTYTHRWGEMSAILGQSHQSAPARGWSREVLARQYLTAFSLLRRPWRVVKVGVRYGVTTSMWSSLASSVVRWLNARIPMTPNAIRARWANE